MKFIKEYFGWYYLLYFFSFLAIYFFPPVLAPLNIAILIISYHLIVKHRRLDVIICLILYSRCLNGFIIPHNKTAYLLINLLSNIVPILLYYATVLRTDRTLIDRKRIISKYQFTLLFFALLTLHFVFNFSTSADLITRRYLPFAFFILFLIFSSESNDFNAHGMIRFFRSVFLASLIVYFFSNYLDITRALIESDSVFSKSSTKNSYSLIYLSFVRNMGFIWDHRITAIFVYLYLLFAVIFKFKYFKLDILLSLIVVITSTSRGGMITYMFILFAYFFQIYRFKLVAMVFTIVFAALVVVIFSKNILPPRASKFLTSFNPKSKYNVLTQREFFSSYSLESFKQKKVFGHGVGYLSSTSIDRGLVVDHNKVNAITDAYWYILLGEMGILGFILYLLFLLEVFNSTSVLNIALLAGFSLQLLGTDIPDMRFYYFAILILVYVANKKLKMISKSKLVPVSQ